MLQLVRNDGAIEVWDLLTRSDTYILTQSVSGKTLTGKPSLSNLGISICLNLIFIGICQNPFFFCF